MDEDNEKLRVEWIKEGYYVIEGMLYPVKNRADGELIVEDIENHQLPPSGLIRRKQ